MLLFAEVVVLTLPHLISTAFSTIEYTGENDLSVFPSYSNTKNLRFVFFCTV